MECTGTLQHSLVGYGTKDLSGSAGVYKGVSGFRQVLDGGFYKTVQMFRKNYSDSKNPKQKPYGWDVP